VTSFGRASATRALNSPEEVTKPMLERYQRQRRAHPPRLRDRIELVEQVDARAARSRSSR
jgi:hypothetical protein